MRAAVPQMQSRKENNMNFGFIGAFIVFCIVVSHNIKKQARQRRNKENAFWARELESNSVRKKSLDSLPYITIPLERFPTHLLPENATVMECIQTLEDLTTQKIVNLTGWSNTDLKLEYGTSNLTPLSEYDQNYTLLVRTLQKWADELIAAGYEKEAFPVMEFAVNTGTDISSTYYKLADYWISRGDTFHIKQLIHTAEGLRSANRNSILRHLREKCG